MLFALVSLAIPAAISFTPVWANIAALVLADAAYCFLTFSCWRLRPAALKFTAIGLLSLPIIGAYALLTLGAFPLVFFAADYVEPPLSRDFVAPGVSCTTTGWGAAFSDEGYTVHLFHAFPLIPFVHREVGQIVVDETDPGAGPTSATCTDVMKAHP